MYTIAQKCLKRDIIIREATVIFMIAIQKIKKEGQGTGADDLAKNKGQNRKPFSSFQALDSDEGKNSIRRESLKVEDRAEKQLPDFDRMIPRMVFPAQQSVSTEFFRLPLASGFC